MTALRVLLLFLIPPCRSGETEGVYSRRPIEHGRRWTDQHQPPRPKQRRHATGFGETRAQKYGHLQTKTGDWTVRTDVFVKYGERAGDLKQLWRAQ